MEGTIAVGTVLSRLEKVQREQSLGVNPMVRDGPACRLCDLVELCRTIFQRHVGPDRFALREREGSIAQLDGCVGLGNERYFVMFMAWLSFGCGVVLWSGVGVMRRSLSWSSSWNYPYTPRLLVILLYILALVMGLASDKPVGIDDSAFIATSFPDFVPMMRALGAGIA